MKASSKQNYFDVITSKVRRNRDYCVDQVFLSVVYMPTMNYSCLYLAELRSIQNRCNFATICAQKGYWRQVRNKMGEVESKVGVVLKFLRAL